MWKNCNACWMMILASNLASSKSTCCCLVMVYSSKCPLNDLLTPPDPNSKDPLLWYKQMFKTQYEVSGSVLRKLKVYCEVFSYSAFSVFLRMTIWAVWNWWASLGMARAALFGVAGEAVKHGRWNVPVTGDGRDLSWPVHSDCQLHVFFWKVWLTSEVFFMWWNTFKKTFMKLKFIVRV